MGMSFGNTRIITNGLTHGFDLSDPNLYTGAPTENLFLENNHIDFNGGWGTYDTVNYPTDPAHVYGRNVTYEVTDEALNGNPILRARFFNGTGSGSVGIVSWAGGTKADISGGPDDVTVSIYVRAGTESSVGKNCYITWYSYGDTNRSMGSSPTIQLTRDWQRLQMSFTTASGDTVGQVYVWSQSRTETYYLEMSQPQVEKNSYATEFTRTSRDATSNLQYINNTNKLDATNMSFSGTTMYFDGVDDFMVFPNINYAEKTVAILYREYSYDNGNEGILWDSVSWDERIFPTQFNFIDTNVTYQYINFTKPNVGDWNLLHYTVSTANEEAKAYQFGNLLGTVPLVGGIRTPSCTYYLGRLASGSDYYFYHGEVAMFKIYDRVLSDAEIQKDYIHYKNKFNL